MAGEQMAPRETSRDYANPYRPRGVAALNAALRPVAGRVTPTLTAERLMRAARRAEGLDDFGAPDLVEPLRRLCDAIEAEARLTPFGRIATRTRLVGLLRARLRHRHLYDTTPAIAAVDVRAPIVITGLQRTGTTFLHRLLAADPRLRALRSWEALNPAPLLDRRGDDTRRKQSAMAEKALRYLAPDFFAVHPVEADAPEEEVLLLDQTLLSTTAEATVRVPSFAAWLEDQDQAPAYAMLRELLQSLWWQDPPRDGRGDDARWVLKTPHHLEWLDALLDEFPDAVIVHTHRDPVTTVASFCSMMAHGRGIMTDDVDPHEVGTQWLRKTSRMVERAMDTRARRDTGQFLDVHYDALIADPLEQVRRVYDHAGLSLPDDVEAAVSAKRDASEQYRHGRHVYDGADFGLTDERIAAAFAPYRERFGMSASS